MKLSLKAMALTFGIICAGSILLVGVVQLFAPGYGEDFLEVFAAIYPGFAEQGGFGNILVGTAYGFVDGCIFGALLAWLYNFFSARL